MKSCEKTECSFHKWYPLFKTYTFESVVERLPSEVASYLREDGIILPVEANEPCLKPRNFDPDSSDFTVDWSAAESDLSADSTTLPTFPCFSTKLQEAIDLLGGSVFIKLNWSAPTDSAWITSDKSLKCSCIQDLYLLLNSSDRLMQDLDFPVQGRSKDDPEACHYIVLKKWQNIHPGTEFRCFVINNVLAGISQRDCSDFHSYITQEKFDIIADIQSFYKNSIDGKFSLSTFTFDIIRPVTGKVLLMDFGVFQDENSKSYLFTWQELKDAATSADRKDGPEFRYIGSPTGIQPTNALGNIFGVPYDLQMLNNPNENLNVLMDYVQDEVNRQN